MRSSGAGLGVSGYGFSRCKMYAALTLSLTLGVSFTRVEGRFFSELSALQLRSYHSVVGDNVNVRPRRDTLGEIFVAR